ncbi:MAG: hypothetical protein V9G14_04520 [Cypionkella sp.]
MAYRARTLVDAAGAHAVFPRDALTADRLRAAGVANQAVGNPMMDGLTTAAGWFCEPGQFREQGRLGLLMLPGFRAAMPRRMRWRC